MDFRNDYYNYNDINSLIPYVDPIISINLKEENNKLLQENNLLLQENKRIKEKLEYYDMIWARNRNRARCRLLIKNGLIPNTRFKKISEKMKKTTSEKDCLFILKKEIEKKWKNNTEQTLPLDFNDNISFTQIKLNWTEKIKEWSKQK